jgi:3-oxoadipate enol-lactonase
MPIARIAGTELCYEAEGRGPAVLFLHAFPLSLSMWDAQAAALRADHSVVRFDCRGFGGSPPGDGLLTMERIADDAAALLDQLGVERAVVAGCSMGGYAAFAFVRKHADRVRGLVLADTRAGADSAEARRNRSLLAEKVMREGASAALDAFLPKLLGASTQRENAPLVERLRERILAASPRGIADGLAGLAARADQTSLLREIRVPTLVVCGEEDVLTPPAEAQALHAAISGSRLVLVPGAGHLANLERPHAFNAALRDFLGALPGRGATAPEQRD